MFGFKLSFKLFQNLSRKEGILYAHVFCCGLVRQQAATGEKCLDDKWVPGGLNLSSDWSRQVT